MKIEDEKLQIGALVSAWSPSLTVEVLGVEISIGAEIGAYGASVEVGNGFCVYVAKAIGFSFSIVPAN